MSEERERHNRIIELEQYKESLVQQCLQELTEDLENGDKIHIQKLQRDGHPAYCIKADLPGWSSFMIECNTILEALVIFSEFYKYTSTEKLFWQGDAEPGLGGVFGLGELSVDGITPHDEVMDDLKQAILLEIDGSEDELGKDLEQQLSLHNNCLMLMVEKQREQTLLWTYPNEPLITPLVLEVWGKGQLDC